MKDEEFCEKLGHLQAKITIIDSIIEESKSVIGKINDNYVEKDLAELYKRRMLLKIEVEKLWDTRREFPFNLSKPKQ